VSFLTKAVGAIKSAGDTVPLPESWLEFFGGSPTHAGEPVNSETAMRHSAVYGSRRIIAYTIAGLPADVLVKKPAAAGRFVREPVTPEPRWLMRPNAEQLWPEFVAQAVDSLLGDGNLFLDTSTKGRDGRPGQLFVLNPRAVTVGRMTSNNELVYQDPKGILNRQNLIHVRALTLPGYDRGLSPLEMARQEVGIGQAAQKYLAKFYVNGSTVSAVLEFPPDMTKEQVTENATTFKELYTGSADKAHTVAAVAGASYKPMGLTNEQSQFLELRQYGVVDIGTRIYGIPPHRLGALLDKPQFGNSIEQFNMAFVQDAIMPWTTLLEAAFRRYVLPQPQYLHFGLNGLMRGDSKSRAAFYLTMRQQLGVLNGDDILAFEDMNPMPDGKGQQYWMPANTYLVGDQGFPILPERQSPPSDSASEGGSV